MPPRFKDPTALDSGQYGPDGSGDDTSETAVTVGETVRLQCIVHAVPEAQITWYATLSTRGAVVSGVRRMNQVNASRARLVPGWVTVFGRVYHLGM